MAGPDEMGCSGIRWVWVGWGGARSDGLAWDADGVGWSGAGVVEGQGGRWGMRDGPVGG